MLLFSTKKKELNGVTLSALLCLHSRKKKHEKKRRKVRGFSEHSVLVKSLSSPAHFKKGLQ